ncbi:MAG: hypothetical protein AABY47_00655, partial [Pseudomonadota bacterium]
MLIGIVKKSRKNTTISYLVALISLLYSEISISEFIKEPPVAGGFQYARQALDQYLYPNPDKLGQQACNDINATQTDDQLRIFGPIVFSRTVVTSNLTNLSVYCAQSGNEFLANGFPGAGSISGWF